MTKENITTETAKVVDRIAALESVAAYTAPLNGEAENIIDTMLYEYKARYEYLISPKEYMVHFEGGGWNTCYGANAEEAFDNAVIEHEAPGCADGCKVRSGSLATKEGINAAMRLFY